MVTFCDPVESAPIVVGQKSRTTNTSRYWYSAMEVAPNKNASPGSCDSCVMETNRPPSRVRVGGIVQEITGCCWLRKINASELHLGCNITRHLTYVDILRIYLLPSLHLIMVKRDFSM